MHPLPAALHGRYERRGLAAMTYDKLIVTPLEVFWARWADLGGRWCADPVRASMDGDEVRLEDGDAAVVLLVRRRGGRTFLVEPRHQAAFDADPDEERRAWIDRAERGEERGQRAFLQVDLAAYWSRTLVELRSEAARAGALARLASAAIEIAREEDPAADEPALEVLGALLEGVHHVDAVALLEAVLDAGRGAEGRTWTDWYRVLDDVDPAHLPARIPAALRSRLAATGRG